MKTLLLLAALSTAPAFAAALPLNAIYGTPEACEDFAAGGLEGVEAAGDGGSDEENYALVTSAGMFGFESACEFNGTALGKVSTTCGGESGDEAFLTWFDVSFEGEALIVKSEYQEIKLHPCPTSETPTM